MNSFITAMHIDAHTILHCQLQSSLFLFQKVSLCFSEWAGSLSPSCRKCKRTSWKARVYVVPCKVRGELLSLHPSCHLLSSALVLQTLLRWGDRKCLSYRYWASYSQRSTTRHLWRTFLLLALLWLIHSVTLKALRTCSGKDYDNL